MEMFSNVLLLVICMLLLAIAWQDFRTRTVYVFLFVLLFIAVCTLQYIRCGFTREWLMHMTLNASVISMQLLAVYSYLKIIRKINFFEGLGLGDIFFFVCIIPVLSLPVFIFFNISSLVCALLLYVIAGNKMQIQSTAIPLAGIQALTLILTIVIAECFFSIPVLGSCFLLAI